MTWLTHDVLLAGFTLAGSIYQITKKPKEGKSYLKIQKAGSQKFWPPTSFGTIPAPGGFRNR